MLRAVLLIMVFFQITAASAQTRPLKEIKCQGRRTNISLSIKDCKLVNYISKCTASVAIDSSKVFAVELFHVYKQTSSNENVSLLLYTNPSDTIKISFSGPYVRSKGVFIRNENYTGSVLIQSPNLSFREAMMCTVELEKFQF